MDAEDRRTTTTYEIWAVYDNDCANVYVNQENEVTYEPALLGHFRTLVETCERLEAALVEDEKAKVSAKPSLPTEYAGTAAGLWFSQLTRSIDVDGVNTQCSWTDDDEHTLTAVHERIAEAHPGDRAKMLWRMKQRLADLRITFETLQSQLADDAFLRLRSCRETAKIKRQAATADAKKVFENAPLAGVASDSWRLLWNAARSYSEHEAYKDAAFPFIDDGARCVLCQQSLADDAKGRLSAFEAYMRGALEADAALPRTPLAPSSAPRQPFQCRTSSTNI